MRQPFAMVPEWIVAAVSPRAVAVYCFLARRADEERCCWPSRATIAGFVRCSVRTVTRALDELVAAGAIERELDNGRGSRYRLAAEPPAVSPVTLVATHPGQERPGTRDTGGPPPGTLVSQRTRTRIKTPPGGCTQPAQLIALPRPEPRRVPTGEGLQELVGHYVDRQRAVNGVDPPRRIVGHLARELGELAKEGRSLDLLERTIDRFVELRFATPSSLASLALELDQGPRIRAGPAEPRRGPRVDCPQCGVELSPARLPWHLRDVHGVEDAVPPDAMC
jgi:hypothetical protein